MNIALDAMGGDYAPEQVVKGALEVASQIHGKIYLVGIPQEIEKWLPSPAPKNFEIVPATQLVGMDERPLTVYRTKPDSSLRIAVDMVKEGKAGAFVSAGNTGACVATCQLSWRQMPGFNRPAIATLMPHKDGRILVLDTGATADPNPEHLVEFAIMGRAYAEQVMKRKNPKVHLLNIGEEETKGNAFYKQAYKLLKNHDWFAGNIEGKDMYSKPCDVIVCDAFVGNVMLKCSEGVFDFMVRMIREGVPTNPVLKPLYRPLRKLMAPIRKKADWREVGGSPLLGLNGVCIICHGVSDAKAIRNALLMAQSSMESDLVSALKTGIQQETVS